MKKSRSRNGSLSIGQLLNVLIIASAKKMYPKLKLGDATAEMAKNGGFSQRNLIRLRHDDHIPRMESILSLTATIPEVEILNPLTMGQRLLIPESNIDNLISNILKDYKEIDFTIITTNAIKFANLIALLLKNVDGNKTIKIILVDCESNILASNVRNTIVKECLNQEEEDVDDIIGFVEDLTRLIDDNLDITTILKEGMIQDMILVDIANLPMMGIKYISGFNVSVEVLEILKKDNDETIDLTTSGYLFMPEDEIARAIEVFDIQTETT
jgi:hypothetical protein